MESGSILEEDKKVLLLILSTYAWLYRQLQAKKLGIQRLRNLFGFSTEVRSKLKKKDDNIPADLKDSFDSSQGGNVPPLKKHQNEIQEKIMGD